MDFTLAVAMLQLLYAIYVEQRRRNDAAKVPDPQRVRELIDEVQQLSEARWDEAEIGRRIDLKFQPEEARRVKDDLALFQLFAEPPNLERFDYWGLLSRFVSGLQQLGLKNHLFRLRGRKAASTVVLDLSRTPEKLLPIDRAKLAFDPLLRNVQIRIDSISAALLQSAPDLPIRVVIKATFEKYHGIPGTESQWQDFAIYRIVPGQQPHWLKFELSQSAPSEFQGFEFMLTAPVFEGIIQALRDDIHAFVSETNANDSTMAPLFQQIDAFLRGV